MKVCEARRQILGRLRATQGPAAPGAAVAPLRRFPWDRAQRLARFGERLTAVRGEVHRVDGQWPEFLCDLLRGRRVRDLLYGPGGRHGETLARGWPDGGAVRLRPYLEPVEQCRASLFDPALAGFSACRGAVAETGRLVLWPDADEPRLLSLVPPLHVILLDADAIYSTFAELLDAQGWADAMPTNALLITGPSKSADIEQTLTYGVHGPKELIVLVL